MTADPLVLGFETSGGWCAAALVRGQTVLESTDELMARGQAERLMPMLEEMLARHGVTWTDLRALGVGVGPGNFTGIRIGVSAARGLALGLGIPAYGIDGFEQRALLQCGTGPFLVPAPRDMFYMQSNGDTRQLSRDDLNALGQSVPEEPATASLATAVAILAIGRFPADTPAPAPRYIRPPDAAPARDAPPRIIS